MTGELAAGIVLAIVPIAFNLAFFELGRTFDYPDILRREPDEILRRFHAGGLGLAGTIVPIAYVAWSIWLIAQGVLLIV
jgi:hypothetical protein